MKLSITIFFSVILMTNVKAQTFTGSVDINQTGTGAAALNLRNPSGFWHISGPRSSETGNNLTIFYNNNSIFSPKLTITDAGRFGIGSTTPSTTLQINSNSSEGVMIGSSAYPSWMGTNGLYVEGSLRANSYLLNSGSAINWGASRAWIGGKSTTSTNPPANDTYLNFGTANIERMRIGDDGTIGVGIIDPLIVHPSSTLFASKKPLMELRTGITPGEYSEIVTVRHTGIDATVANRRLGFLMKLSGEDSPLESSKMGGMLLESTDAWANNPTLSLLTNNSKRLTIDYQGNIGIGATDTKGYKLAVNGSMVATSIKVKEYSNWPDYVFKPKYQLRPLSEVKIYIDKYQHLPEVPSAATVEKEGLNLGEMNAVLMKKVEELTLYLIEKDKQMNAIQNEVNKLKSALAQNKK